MVFIQIQGNINPEVLSRHLRLHLMVLLVKKHYTGMSGSRVSIFGNDDVVLQNITDCKGVEAAVRDAIMLPTSKKTKGKAKETSLADSTKQTYRKL